MSNQSPINVFWFVLKKIHEKAMIAISKQVIFLKIPKCSKYQTLQGLGSQLPRGGPRAQAQQTGLCAGPGPQTPSLPSIGSRWLQPSPFLLHIRRAPGSFLSSNTLSTEMYLEGRVYFLHLDLGFQMPFSTKRTQDLLREWLIPGLWPGEQQPRI